jgi:rhodanese-related sulfurtransferase
MLNGLLNHSVPEITVGATNRCENCVFLDAREQNEFDVSHIQHAVWVGYKTFDVETIRNIAKNKKIVVYCSVGYRSEKVAEKLLKAGYTDVSNLYGGIFEWVNAGNIVYKNAHTPTNEVHAYGKMWSRWLNKGTKVYN